MATFLELAKQLQDTEFKLHFSNFRPFNTFSHTENTKTKAQHENMAINLLKDIMELPLKEQAEMLLKEDKRGSNILMLAARYYPEAIDPLLNAMKTLRSDQQIDILKKIDKAQWNALMLAACYQPQAIRPLLAAIKGLPAQDQKAIQIQITKDEGDIRKISTDDKWNALMLVAGYNPAYIPDLLAATAEDPDVQFRTLKQSSSNPDTFNQNRMNAFMIAMDLKPEYIAPLLEVINNLTKDKQIALLTTLDKSFRNALMLAALNGPEITLPLLEIISKFPDSVRERIFNQEYNVAPHWITLTLVLKNDPESIKNWPPEILADILNISGEKALDFAIEHYPKLLNPLLEAIALSTIDLNTKYELISLGLFHSKDSNRMSKKSDILHVFWEKDIRYLLKQLKDEVPSLPQALAKQQLAFHDSLEGDLKIYLGTKKTAEDITDFRNSWEQKIKHIRGNKALLSGNPNSLPALSTVLYTLGKILLMLSFFGTIYSLYKARENSAQNRSLFFPGKLERLIDDLQEKKDKDLAEGVDEKKSNKAKEDIAPSDKKPPKTSTTGEDDADTDQPSVTPSSS